MRDVQDAASHADPRTTKRYDRGRQSLDRHATCIVAAFVAGAYRTGCAPAVRAIPSGRIARHRRKCSDRGGRLAGIVGGFTSALDPAFQDAVGQHYPRRLRTPVNDVRATGELRLEPEAISALEGGGQCARMKWCGSRSTAP